MSKSNVVSFIEDHEVDEAKEVVKNAFLMASKGRPFEMRPAGYMVAIKVYIRPEEITKVKDAEGKDVTLYRPPSVTAEDKYVSSVGVVMAVGPEAYQGKTADGTPRFTHPWCRVGDWVAFPRGEGYMTQYRGVAMVVIPDDRILFTVTDPADVMTGTAEYKI